MKTDGMKAGWEKAKRGWTKINQPKTMFIGAMALGILMATNGYCQQSSETEINNLTTNIMETIFSPWVRKAALVFGGGAGLIQAWTAGSFKPMALWGGLGLAVNYVPKFVDVIARVGS